MKNLSLFCLIGISLAQVPYGYQLNRGLDAQAWSGLPSNSVVDLRLSDDGDVIYLGTSGGVAYADVGMDGSLEFFTFSSEFYPLPEGGNPGLAVKGSVIAVSGAVEELAAGEYHPAGSGVSYSVDGGLTWEYKAQYVAPPDSPDYIPFEWGGQTLSQLAVTTEINNVSYDLAIHGDYIYAASWAGGLRRFKYQNFGPAPEGEDPNPWEAVALPMDADVVQYCGFIDEDSFELNPNDPENGGSHNHKGFSVYAHEDTLWVGTAAGINKGVVDPLTGCIDWRHFTAQMDGFSGNWVIGFTHQDLTDDQGTDFTRIWAATWSTGSGESYAVSYTDNGGDTWNIAPQIEEMGLKVYGLSVTGERVFAASEEGLYASDDGLHWEKFSRPETFDGPQILSQTVYSAVQLDTVPLLVVGTPDGVGSTPDEGITWNIYRFWVAVEGSGDDEDQFYAYPNPFYLNSANVIDGDGHVRFVFAESDAEPELHIFDFSMALVVRIDSRDIHPATVADSNQLEVIWDGRNDWGDPVANGVYFCRLTRDSETLWTKLLVIN